MTPGTTQVFVYGTLADTEQIGELLADWRFDGEAVLEGLHRVEGRYPTLAPDGSVAGQLVVTSELDRLDAYEGVDHGLYVRVAVPLGDDDQAWVYVGDPDRLDAPADWPGEGSFADRVHRYIETQTVLVRRAGNR